MHDDETRYDKEDDDRLLTKTKKHGPAGGVREEMAGQDIGRGKTANGFDDRDSLHASPAPSFGSPNSRNFLSRYTHCLQL